MGIVRTDHGRSVWLAAALSALAWGCAQDATSGAADGDGSSDDSSGGAGPGAGPGDDDVGVGSPAPVTRDPGQGEWQVVPRDEVAEVCGLDPALLEEADAVLGKPWGVVRYGKLCHQYYPEGQPTRAAAWSATKTLAATAMGLVAFHTADLERSGPKTGPLSDEDRVDHWLDSVEYNPDAHIAHVMGMVAHTDTLDTMSYDAAGDVQINTLSAMANVALAQLPGAPDFDAFVHDELFTPLGFEDSEWFDGEPAKIMAYGWMTTVRDMLRLGLLLVHDGEWGGEQLLSADWVYRMTHPSFEEATPNYGYLTWLNLPCAPRAMNRSFPHGLSKARDCGVPPCAQRYDAGVFYAAGLGGQYIVGHRGLDLVLAIQDAGDGNSALVWETLRPALVALDPVYQGDEDAFCRDYSAGEYAPDL